MCRWSGVSRPGPKIPPVVLSDAERAVLQSWARRRSSARSLVLRSRIVLESADGQAIADVARRLGITTDTVRVWHRRLLVSRLDCLCDEPGTGVSRNGCCAWTRSRRSRRWTGPRQCCRSCRGA
ncbi:helix-turn-helix domain-containing protein [Streptomyces sp. NPDC096311]|uniref:helix-turn-helix domain-containing protein n=1 Tax=Streptomyces sp. NPDC096311 TaxID=3366083 RepID=UPI003816997A